MNRPVTRPLNSKTADRPAQREQKSVKTQHRSAPDYENSSGHTCKEQIMSMQQPLHKYHCQKAQETAGETVQETDGLTEEQGR